MSRGAEVRRRLDSAETLGTVVTTMKTLASVRIGQYRRSVAALEASSTTLDLALQAVVTLYPELLEDAAVPAGSSLAAVVFGSDRGLCGHFNERVAQHAAQTLPAPQLTDGEGSPSVSRSREAPADDAPAILAVGRRMVPRLRARGLHVEQQVRPPGALDTVDTAVMDVLVHVDAWRSAARADRLLLIHAQPTSAAAYEPRVVQVLPLDTAWLRTLRGRPWPTKRLPMAISDAHDLVQGVVRQRIAHALVRAFAASQAAENAARLAAMDAAERNIEERITALRTAYNQARQNAITEELLDIQAAYAATGGERLG